MRAPLRILCATDFSDGAKLGGSHTTSPKRRFSRASHSNTSATTNSCASGSRPLRRKLSCAAAIAPAALSTVTTRRAPASAACTENPPV